MDELEFEWDAGKARSNARKHGVTFTEAMTIFRDRRGRLLAEHLVQGEERRVMVGLSDLDRLLVVVFVDRGRIRIKRAASNAV